MPCTSPPGLGTRPGGCAVADAAAQALCGVRGGLAPGRSGYGAAGAVAPPGPPLFLRRWPWPPPPGGGPIGGNAAPVAAASAAPRPAYRAFRPCGLGGLRVPRRPPATPWRRATPPRAPPASPSGALPAFSRRARRSSLGGAFAPRCGAHPGGWAAPPRYSLLSYRQAPIPYGSVSLTSVQSSMSILGGGVGSQSGLIALAAASSAA